MKLPAKILLLLLVGLYILTRWARTHMEIPVFFKYHFTDLLFVPVQLMTALWVTRWLKRDKSIRINPVWVILQVILVSLLFEWYMPVYGTDREKFTGDPVDAAMYLIGGICFLCFQWWEARIQNPKLRIT